MKKSLILLGVFFCITINAVLPNEIIKFTLKNDIKHAIEVNGIYFEKNQSYKIADSKKGVSDGKIKGTLFTVSGNNILKIKNRCKDNINKGFYIIASNQKVKNKYEYDSCTQGKIIEI